MQTPFFFSQRIENEVSLFLEDVEIEAALGKGSWSTHI